MNPNAPMGEQPTLNDALKSGNVGKFRQYLLWSRKVVAASTAIAGTKQILFDQARATAPAFTNMFEANRMGPREAFTCQGISLVLNPNNTGAGWIKYCAESFLFVGLGADNIEQLRVPLHYLPSPLGCLWSGTAPDLRSTTPYGFWRLEGQQAFTINAGTPFEVSVNHSSAAVALGVGEAVDFAVVLHGVYQQQITV